MRVTVLRLGHRLPRDARTTTHVLLTARAFGAVIGMVAGENDPGMLEAVRKLVQNFGGPFTVKQTGSWRKEVTAAKRRGQIVVHLTMYGEKLTDRIPEIRSRSHKGLLAVVGGEKVPPEIYKLADYNISVTNQPHSEVAALAVFLHELFVGKELEKKFTRARIRVVPSALRKIVLSKKTRTV